MKTFVEPKFEVIQFYGFQQTRILMKTFVGPQFEVM